MTNPIQVQKFLGGVDYPADREKILSVARSHGVDQRIIQLLEKIPDRVYEGPNAISKEIGVN
ncbi:DUF2795 domain-containing protein [Protofrankia symbiont of Coriaria ruscifolia]|uniref:DUF2795 domain-containing protein n=1 Tax=Candidatus Protofrankia californiensis TaxID=1839754 RepID=A0A1C3NT59_9ACTN|nr:DUF2795 domain-containing protein [Protofrankia symbiont of Coriaria ruscifolia]SBW17538.1 hypothetical protein FDG2_0262 [Candidatus Protofrankia californiensis]